MPQCHSLHFRRDVREHPPIASDPGDFEIHRSCHAEACDEGGPMAEHIAKVFHFILKLFPAKLVSNVQHERLSNFFRRSTQMIGRQLESSVGVPASGNVIIRVS